MNPSLMGKNGRRSPRLGPGNNGNNKRPSTALASGRGILVDVTNVSEGCISTMEKLKPINQQIAPSSLQIPSAVSVEPKPALPAVSAEQSNPQNVEEYVSDITSRLFENETQFLPHPEYMSMQMDITPKMRAILMDWLIEVHMKYHLSLETLHLTVNLIDRYLAKQQVSRKHLQLVGVVAMFIASKYEEISPPELHDWVYITDKAYTNNDVLVTECTMLSLLAFNIMVPTPAHFFDLISDANGCDAVQRNVVLYLIELGILDIRMLKYKPSHMVSAAMMLSNEVCRREGPAWPAKMCQLTNLTQTDLQECADVFRELLDADQVNGGGQLQAVHKKFSLRERNEVAKMAF